MNEDQVNKTRQQIENYGSLINNSLKIDCMPLVSSVDGILRILSEYFKFVDKVLSYFLQKFKIHFVVKIIK